MPSLKDTKRRIASVKSTQKITRAMKLVSSAKYARANRAVINAAEYSHALDQMLGRFVGNGKDGLSPLFQPRTEKKVVAIVVSPDRGLCGGLNAALLKRTMQFLEEKRSAQVAVELVLWGRRAEMFGLKRQELVIERKHKVLDKPSLELAQGLAYRVADRFAKGEIDGVYCVFTKFKSALSQVPTVIRLLPADGSSEVGTGRDDRPYLVEPDVHHLVDVLVMKSLVSKIYRILLDGSASEHAARMTAMDSATNNAEEVISRLTLQYNRARQAAITKELIEITSGADAL